MINYDQFLVENADRVEVVLHRLSTNLAFFKEEGLEPVIRKNVLECKCCGLFLLFKIPISLWTSTLLTNKRVWCENDEIHIHWSSSAGVWQRVTKGLRPYKYGRLYGPFYSYGIICAWLWQDQRGKTCKIWLQSPKAMGRCLCPPLLKAKPLFSNLFVIVSLKC